MADVDNEVMLIRKIRTIFTKAQYNEIMFIREIRTIFTRAQRLDQVLTRGDGGGGGNKQHSHVVRRLAAFELVSGTDIPEIGGENSLHLRLHCHHQNKFCIKVGSNESHLDVLLTAPKGKIT